MAMRSAKLGSVLVSMLVLVLPLVAPAGPAEAASTLNGHTVLTDSTGKLIPWVGAQDSAYPQILALNTDFLLKGVPNDPSTGRPAYLSQSYLNPDTLGMAGWPHNPAGLYSMLATSGLEYSAYTGSPALANLARAALDTQLASGMTSASDNWANVPYASGDPGSLTYRGASYGSSTGVGDGPGVIEPDKVGDEGLAFLKMYLYTQDSKYLAAALAAADALASHVRTGSATQSPWPFRVYAATGVVREQYTANVIGAIGLFDWLVKLGLGNTAAYQSARNTAWTWLLAYPMTNNNWANYFEDVPVQSGLGNINQLIPMETARYLLAHPEHDPAWESHVRGLLAWVTGKFATTSNGATVIREQNAFAYTMGSHTSRYASINAMLYERTGDTAALAEAYRSFNWATYMVRSNGVTIDGPDVNNMWFTDGYGDFIRHFMAGIGANPLWSPAGERHILRSTSVVRGQSSGSDWLEYTSAEPASVEVLRFPGGVSAVTAGGLALSQRADLAAQGYTYDQATGVLRIRHDSAAVIRITAGAASGNVAPSTTLTAPLAGTSLTAPASVGMSATAADADGSVTKVEFLGDGMVVATDTSAPYAATWSGVAEGTHQVAARASDDDGAVTTTGPVTVTVTAEPGNPGQWTSSDVGTVGAAGSMSTSAGTFTVRGSGEDIWSTDDGFQFAYQQVSGDTEIRARVVSQTATEPWALAGIMVRESLASGSRHALAAVTPGNGISFTYRSATGGSSSYVSGGAGTTPHWLRVVRSGSTLTAYRSTTGTTWTQYASATISMSSSVLVGLAVTSHVPGTLGTATFDNVTVGDAPVADTTAPAISAVLVPTANQNGASVNWTTNEPATSQVEYGTTTAYGSTTALNTSLDTAHSQVVAGLDAATTYHFRVRSTDAAGNTSTSADYTFTTQSAADTTPPVISVVTAATTANSATLTWTTNEPATSQVDHGTTSAYGSTTTLDTSLVTAHSQAVAGLAAGTTYHFRVRSTDAAGNTSVSADAIFTVVAAADTTPPSVAITAPTSAATVAGATTVAATATDNRAVAGVQFLLDGVALAAEDTAAPYSVSWDTTKAAAGAHSLSARARDAAGNTATSTPVAVTVNNAAVIPSGLVAAYGFNEGTGTSVADSSGNGLLGTATGTVAWVTGKYGKAMSFNGTSTMVSVADAAALRLTKGMTVSAWVQPSSNSGWRTIAMREVSGGLSYSLYGSNGSRPASYGNIGGDVGATGTSALSTTAWTHVAGTYDGTSLRLYVNGVLVSTKSASGSLSSSAGALRIGGNSVWGEYFRGYIDEVRIYNRAQVASEIAADMGRAL